jgi:hypothetical protein
MQMTDLSVGSTRICSVRKLLVRFTMVGMVLVAGPGVASGGQGAVRSDSTIVPVPSGASVSRVEIPEGTGVIQLFRVVAPAGIRVRVTGVIPGLAGVNTVIRSVRRDDAETCARHGRSVVCTQAGEACPMPAATWEFLVRKIAGPAGRIRIDFVVGPAHSV